jgi:hypothetical protein
MNASSTIAEPPVSPAAPRTAKGPSERTACALATGIAEQLLGVLTGRRPLDHAGIRVSGPVAGLINATRRSNPLDGPNYRLRSVHACLTTAHRVEACAVVGTASRVRALVMRLEQHSTTWWCTMLAVL